MPGVNCARHTTYYWQVGQPIYLLCSLRSLCNQGETLQSACQALFGPGLFAMPELIV